MARKNAMISVSTESNVITFNIEGHDAIVIDVSKLSDDVRTRAIIHGITQKVSDAAALGKDADITEKWAAMSAVAGRLIDGEWNKRAEAGSAKIAGGIILRAVVEYVTSQPKNKMTAEAVREWFAGKTRSEQLSLRKEPAIAAIIERMKAEKGNVESINSSALLDELK